MEAAKSEKSAAKGSTLCYLSSPALEIKQAGTVSEPFCAIQAACDVLTQKRTQPLDSSGLSKSIPSHSDSFNTKKRRINTWQQRILIRKDTDFLWAENLWEVSVKNLGQK